MKVIGYKRSNFVSKEGNQITGIKVYCTYPLTGDDADGVGCDSFYLSDAKLARCGYTPLVGDEVNVSYNRFGKVEMIFPVKA